MVNFKLQPAFGVISQQHPAEDVHLPGRTGAFCFERMLPSSCESRMTKLGIAESFRTVELRHTKIDHVPF
jgi:hypothetical protein